MSERVATLRSGLALGAFWSLTKPRVNAMIVFTAMVGFVLAQPGFIADPLLFLATTLGIALVAASAAAFNCLFEMARDRLMDRTANRPLPSGQMDAMLALGFAGLLGSSGLGLLFWQVNALTAWLTLAAFFGYSVIYTIWLKPRTAQNIVLGGAAGALPPLLGWTAASNALDWQPLLLVLIIFLWTPPHFWSLALYRHEDFARAGLPMLPVTRGPRYTKRAIMTYTVVLSVASILPVLSGMSGWIYLAGALALDARFLQLALRLLRAKDTDMAMAQRTFRFSVQYIGLLFAFLLLDRFF